MPDLLGFFCVSFIQFLSIAIPLPFLSYFRKSLKPLIATGWLIIFILLDDTLLGIPQLFSHFAWNFEGKFLEILWPLTLIYVFGFLSPKQVGLKWPNHTGQLLLGAGIGVLFALCNIVIDMVMYKGQPPVSFSNTEILETLLYQFTMPGLAEELIFRGVFLALLNQYLGYQKRIFKVQVGWGIILVSILFIMTHLITYDTSQHSIVWIGGEPKTILSLVVITSLLGFLREKTNSIWSSVLCHNFANGMYFACALFMQN